MVEIDGFTVVLLLRLTPPFTVLFVCLGAASSDAASRIHGEGMQPWHIAVLAVSTAAAVVLGSAISRLARRTLAGSSDVAAADC